MLYVKSNEKKKIVKGSNINQQKRAIFAFQKSSTMKANSIVCIYTHLSSFYIFSFTPTNLMVFYFFKNQKNQKKITEFLFFNKFKKRFNKFDFFFSVYYDIFVIIIIIILIIIKTNNQQKMCMYNIFLSIFNKKKMTRKKSQNVRYELNKTYN